MATVQDILANKSQRLLSIGPEESSLNAAVLMNRNNVGSLLVMNGKTVVGIITERDLLQRVLAQERDPGSTPVDDVMTAEVFCCCPETTIEEARTVMKNRCIRHLPVVGKGGRLHGLVSIGDLNARDVDGQELTIHVMNETIFDHSSAASRQT